jgi:lysophospholipid acyltransferase (LPLAT)-like uncharacterized protein
MSGEGPRWTHRAAGFLGAALLRLLRLTWRVTETPHRFVATRRAARTGPPGTIYVQWHSRILLSSATQARTGLTVLVSQHGDGEYIVQAIERMGFGTIRGSTTRGGAKALLKLVRALQDGRDVALTPDGPKGPRLRVQQGCVIAASKARAPIVPVAFECSRARRLASWDRFVVPWPLVRVAVVAGEPIEVPPGLDEAGVEEWRGRVEAGLLDVTRRAAEIVGTAAESADVDPRATAAAPAG